MSYKVKAIALTTAVSSFAITPLSALLGVAEVDGKINVFVSVPDGDTGSKTVHYEVLDTDEAATRIFGGASNAYVGSVVRSNGVAQHVFTDV